MDKSQVGIFGTHETKDERVDRLGNKQSFIMLNKECVQLVVVERFGAELNVFMADICKDCSL